MARATVDLDSGVMLHILTPGEVYDPKDQCTFWKFVISKEGQPDRAFKVYVRAGTKSPATNLRNNLHLWLHYIDIDLNSVEEINRVKEVLSQLIDQIYGPSTK